MNIIEIKHLSKHYKNTIALNNVSLSISEGEIFGLLGPNGAGKTTLIRCLLGLIRPSSGFATVFGFDICKDSYKIRKRASLLPQEANCMEMLTAHENIFYQGGIHSGEHITKKELIRRTNDLLELVDLSNRQDELTRNFSGGMKRRVLVASTLVMNPDLIFFDEPTTAIDIIGAQNIRGLIEELSKHQNKTIFLTTHDLTDINELCDRVGIISEGNILAVGRVEDLEAEYQVHGIENVYTYLVKRKDNKEYFNT
ncbi:MAG: ABC transporter ATP-binding protein [Candidatus Hodarchaeota archaeon]